MVDRREFVDRREVESLGLPLREKDRRKFKVSRFCSKVTQLS
jgi:hypothetical protein